MNSRFDDQTVFERFRQWLEETRAAAGGLSETEAGSAESAEERPVGLLELVEQFTALRHEVKLQTKSARGLAERTDQALAGLQQALELCRAAPAQESEATREAVKPLVESLIDLDEALGRGRAVIDTARARVLEDLTGPIQEELDNLLLRLSPVRRWLCRSWARGARASLIQRAALAQREIFDSLGEGYNLILNRLQRAMQKAELYRIECVGKRVDPKLMTVVEVVDDPLRPPGIVIEEVRPGYYWKDKVIRFAEVRAVQGRTA